MSGFISESLISSLKLVGEDYGGLPPEDRAIVHVTISGGNLSEPLVLYSLEDQQNNPQEISGKKEFGVEQIDTLPWKQLTQNTRKDATWGIGFNVITHKQKYSDLIKSMNAGPYMLVFSLFKIPVYLKSLSFVQHAGREFYFTWTFEFEEKNSNPKGTSTYQAAEQFSIEELYRSDLTADE